MQPAFLFLPSPNRSYEKVTVEINDLFVLRSHSLVEKKYGAFFALCYYKLDLVWNILHYVSYS